MLKQNLNIMTTIEFNTQLMKLENQLSYFALSLTNDDEDAKVGRVRIADR